VQRGASFVVRFVSFVSSRPPQVFYKSNESNEFRLLRLDPSFEYWDESQPRRKGAIILNIEFYISTKNTKLIAQDVELAYEHEIQIEKAPILQVLSSLRVRR
jgi:hypothetical protein